MPELPEVETIRRGLEKKIVDKKIKKIFIEPSFEKKISPEKGEFLGLLVGQSVKKVLRRSKLLIFEINEDLYLLIHLKMTGQLVYSKGGNVVSGGHPIKELNQLPNKYSRVIFYFSDKGALYFNDIRKFGFLRLVNHHELEQEKAKYGVEPFDNEYTFKFFDDVTKRRGNTTIKTLLLDQKFIAGLGNIYADEACFLAGVKPTRRVKTLTKNEKELIFLHAKKILEKAIKYKGTSFNTYVGSDGNEGNFQNQLFVYGRKDELCKKCKKGEIKKTKIGTRSTSFCPICQK